MYAEYGDKIFRYCLGRLRSREEAEDATQNTFLRVCTALRKGTVPELEGPWLYKIAHNVCLSRRLGSSRRARVETPADLDALGERAVAHTPDVDELFGLGEALAEMPSNLRRPLLLREWQGMSYMEIADALGVSHSAVETLIFRARRAPGAGAGRPGQEDRPGGRLHLQHPLAVRPPQEPRRRSGERPGRGRRRHRRRDRRRCRNRPRRPTGFDIPRVCLILHPGRTGRGRDARADGHHARRRRRERTQRGGGCGPGRRRAGRGTRRSRPGGYGGGRSVACRKQCCRWSERHRCARSSSRVVRGAPVDDGVPCIDSHRRERHG